MKVKSITPIGKADVFNMEVEDTHDFVIQGGVIAHNCVDSIRYLLMSRPIKPRVAAKPDGYNETPQAMYLDIAKKDIVAKPKRARFEIIKE